jgi:hypothetical protein
MFILKNKKNKQQKIIRLTVLIIKKHKTKKGTQE